MSHVQKSTSRPQSPRLATDGLPTDGSMQNAYPLDVHVVILINYLRPHHAVALRALSRRLRKLTILVSVPMEPDRNWEADWEGLNVVAQKNWMWKARWKHSSGFQEPNFIHVPIDTLKQLQRLQPDIVFSYEMGMRTLLASQYRKRHPQIPLVVVGNMSDHIERERGWSRRTLRRWIQQRVDAVTYNGPGCRRYLEQLSIPSERMYPLPYCINPEVVNRDNRSDALAAGPIRMLYCGSISPRKGVLRFVRQIRQWSDAHPQRPVILELAGSGQDRSAVNALRTSNLDIQMPGDLDVAELRSAYARAHLCVFPTLADEWGLVPIEALASGIPVLGSCFAQSVEAVVVDGQNGWVFDPGDPESMRRGISVALASSPERLLAMETVCRQSVAHISADVTAGCFCHIIESLGVALSPSKPHSMK